jgi:FdhD protein
MESISIARIKIKKASTHELLDADDELAVEEPLEIQLVYGDKENRIRKILSVTMRTPGNDEELALGFLFTEGIIRYRCQIDNCYSHPGGNTVSVTLLENEGPLLHQAERNFYTSSSCGICGKASIEALRTVSLYGSAAEEISIKSDLFYMLEGKLRKQQAIFKSTGGLHASALFDLEGNFIDLREDVGRHNALDKLIGAAFLNDRLPLNKRILLLSGRASFELVQKAAMAGIQIVAAVGAPSSLAVRLAEDTGITLIGFLRGKGFNIYSGAGRIRAEG